MMRSVSIKRGGGDGSSCCCRIRKPYALEKSAISGAKCRSSLSLRSFARLASAASTYGVGRFGSSARAARKFDLSIFTLLGYSLGQGHFEAILLFVIEACFCCGSQFNFSHLRQERFPT